jgi:hypothetical protein
MRGSYRAKVFESWGIDLVEKRLILSTLVRLLPEDYINITIVKK